MQRMALGLLVMLSVIGLGFPGTAVTQQTPVTRIGLVTDIGKVDDRTFNEFAYHGMRRAAEEFGLKSAFIETPQPTDYAKNIEQFAAAGYEMIITDFRRRAVLRHNVREASALLPVWCIPWLADLPVVGRLFFRHQPLVYIMFLLVIVVHVVLFATRWGLRTRAVGEYPPAADTLGVNVFKVRYDNVIAGGMIAGLGGAWFSLETVGSFEDLMTGGKGFIALAAMIFGKWRPAGALGGALLFGFADALQLKFQIAGLQVPHQFLSMAPYLATMIALAGVIGRATPPAASGMPYERGT